MTRPADEVVSLIKEVGVWRLGKWDGCCCSHFSVRNVDVSISCGRGGEQAIRVFSPSMDYPDAGSLQPIMDAVAQQVVEHSGRGGTFAQYVGIN